MRSYLLKLKGSENGLEDDRDNWRFKKVDCTGSLIAILVRQLMRTFVGALKSSIYKAMDLGTSSTTLRVIDGFINSKKLETNIRYHFATGAWTVMRGVSPSACTGVCAPKERDFLVRLFAWAPAGRTDSRRRTRSAQVAVTAAPLPRDVFKHVISFWRPNREWWWSDYLYSRVNRYDAPWMG